MPPIKSDYAVDAHDSTSRRHSGHNFLKPTERKMSAVESGIESEPESSLSSSSSSSMMKSNPLQKKGHHGLIHEDNCGCPAADLQGMVIIQLENENRQLRSRLEQSERYMSEMSRQMELQKTRTRQLIAGWKIKLQEGEEKMARHSTEKDKQLASLLSQLMYFEGCLKREREEIVKEIHSKNARIGELEKTAKHQKKLIDALNRANERLLTSLHDTMNRENGDESDSTTSSEDDDDDSSASTSSRNSPVPIMARRKMSMPAAVSFTKLTNGNAANISNNSTPRRRKSAMNGPNPIIHIVHVDSNDTPHHQLSSDSTSPESPRRRVRFDPHVQNNNRGEDSDSENERKQKVRLRKISLPAYRLPTDEEGSIRYF